jgi:type I restriction enzyme S subunit
VVALPTLPEQAAIVRYLDHADEQIQRYIAGKERLIALLEEERRALVHQAVTRGLDPNVRLKPSSVEWLGDVPEHWEVMPLKRAFVSMDYGISDSGSQTGGVRLLTMGNIRDGSVTVPSTGGVTAVDQSLLLGKNDLLFNRTNSAELVAKVGLFSGHDSPVTFASYLVRMRSRSSNEPEYLNMALNETTFLAQARREAVPSLHQSNLNPTRYGRIQISLPPKEEQKTILSALAEKTNGLKTSMELAHRQIELIEEYRTRLIADVVTGKIDVREAKP